METNEESRSVEAQQGPRNFKGLIWGFFLIAAGVVFLLERSGYVDLPGVHGLWPLVFFVIAAAQLAEGRPGSALSMILLGSWFLAVNSDWMGLTYANSWPLLMVVGGVGMVVKSLTGEDGHRRRRRGGKAS